MKVAHFMTLVQVAELAIKQACLTFTHHKVEGATRLPFTYIRINAGTDYDVLYHVKHGSWMTVKKHTTIRVPGSRKGKSVHSAIRSAKTRLEQCKPKVQALTQAKKREKRYNKQTPANLLHKLTRARQLYTQDNMSMSKAARLAGIDYETFKDYTNNPKKYQVKS